MGLPLALLVLALTGTLTGAHSAVLAGAREPHTKQGGAREALHEVQDRRMLLGDLKFSQKELAAHRRRLAVAGVNGPQLARFFITYLKNNVPAYSNWAKVMERTGGGLSRVESYCTRLHAELSASLRTAQLAVRRTVRCTAKCSDGVQQLGQSHGEAASRREAGRRGGKRRSREGETQNQRERTGGEMQGATADLHVQVSYASCTARFGWGMKLTPLPHDAAACAAEPRALCLCVAARPCS